MYAKHSPAGRAICRMNRLACFTDLTEYRCSKTAKSAAAYTTNAAGAFGSSATTRAAVLGVLQTPESSAAAGS